MTPASSDKLAQWLLSSIELDAAALHVGRYCGPWRASTAGKTLASFHLVLTGDCYLHIADTGADTAAAIDPGAAGAGAAASTPQAPRYQPPIHLRARDGVFLTRDVAHFLSPSPDPAAPVARQSMQTLSVPAPPGKVGVVGAIGAIGAVNEAGAAGLACGFFRFGGALGPLVIGSFPDYLVCRSDAPSLAHTASLFDLILAEAGDPEQPSPLIARLVELLFFYLIRHAARQETLGAGMLALAQRSEFMALLDRMLANPGDDWSIARMAQAAHMSRAAFCKHFTEAGGIPPAQFLLRLRMRLASQRLGAGDSVEQAAGHVGYQSYAAFTRAFKRVVGEQPGAYRRQLRA